MKLDTHEESDRAMITAMRITVNNGVTQCVFQALRDHTVIQSPKNATDISSY